MKKILNGILVVEGKSDVGFLNDFIDTEFVITNGSEIPEKTIEYLQKCAKNKDIFVLTDPDSPGKRIRDILDSNIPNLKHCFISKENSIKKNKVGVAESTKEEVLKALSCYFVSKQNYVENIKMTDLVKLNLVGSENSFKNRETLAKKLNLGFCNAKTLLKRLNSCGITIEEIKSLL